MASALLNVWIVCFAVIAGGAFLTWIDRLERKPRTLAATDFSLPMSLAVGAAQLLALIPGVSRPAVAIPAAMLLGADRRAAAEYSLWLAIPSLAGLLACDLYQDGLQLAGSPLLGALGFAAAFLTAWPVARSFPDHVSRHGLTLFAWWRVIVGTLGLIGSV